MNAYHVGQQVRVWVRFTDLEGAATDPTVVTLRLRDPIGQGQILTYGEDLTVVRDDAGEYYAEFIANRAGTWRYRWESSGAITAADEGQFQVLRSAFV